MGDSKSLRVRITLIAYHGQYKYLSNLLDSLDLGNEINLVIHDWVLQWVFNMLEKILVELNLFLLWKQ